MAPYIRRIVGAAQHHEGKDYFAPELVLEFLDLLENSGKPDSVNYAQNLRNSYELENCSASIVIPIFGVYSIIANKKGLIVDDKITTCFF